MLIEGKPPLNIEYQKVVYLIALGVDENDYNYKAFETKDYKK